jgi:enamine deaminase RidA (YjgF/YER057c/UK114 family)
MGMRAALALITLGAALASPAVAQVKRMGAPEAAIAGSVEVPAGSTIIYVSGQVPDVADAKAPEGSVAAYGDTVTQARSVFGKLTKQLALHGLTPADVVMMRVFLVAPPGQERMDFAGMMTAYREVYGTATQPNKPARSTIQVPALAGPGFLVEVEVTAAKAPAK